jgi:hypothetical protein
VDGVLSVQPGVALSGCAVAAAIRIYQKAPSSLRDRIAKIEVDRNDNICLNMHDGIPVTFGQEDDIHAKIVVVDRIYRNHPGIAVQVAAIDVSVPTEPACKPRVTAPSAVTEPKTGTLQRTQGQTTAKKGKDHSPYQKGPLPVGDDANRSRSM